jgi:hypothetical protein
LRGRCEAERAAAGTAASAAGGAGGKAGEFEVTLTRPHWSTREWERDFKLIWKPSKKPMIWPMIYERSEFPLLVSGSQTFFWVSERRSQFAFLAACRAKKNARMSDLHKVPP